MGLHRVAYIFCVKASTHKTASQQPKETRATCNQGQGFALRFPPDPELLGSLDQILAGLGRIDFDRARTLADQIGRPEMRVLMEIDLVQTTLGIKNPSNQPFSLRGMSGMTIMN